jgi:hypothetical protein
MTATYLRAQGHQWLPHLPIKSPNIFSHHTTIKVQNRLPLFMTIVSRVTEISPTYDVATKTNSNKHSGQK